MVKASGCVEPCTEGVFEYHGSGDNGCRLARMRPMSVDDGKPRIHDLHGFHGFCGLEE